MPFSDDNNLEIPTSGVADWDSPLNSNFTTLARGFEFRAVAGAQVNTGDALCMIGTFILPYDAASLEAPRPMSVARLAVSSGATGQFAISGVIRSMDVFSGNITPGAAVFVDPLSLGMLIGCYSAARFPVGWALDDNAVLIDPHVFLPEILTRTFSFELSIGSHATVGSAANFTINMGDRGYMRRIRVITESMDAYKVQLWSGSSRVQSEMIFDTLTTSVDGDALDFDIQSLHWVEGAGFPYWGTESNSRGLIYGTITGQSLSAVGSSTFSLTLWGDRTG